ncbi:hypothetical protein HLB44_01780 [Aquincola sp. S2]|uniref:Uncharacterized protein n=1 Tax=Pseudaquabacterium terrae TaxID=2732868 RepID=A0ABX2E9M5_9BURK|nr:hypothetical protein [Aquabacterium terrae]NRF65706.1 hypothetical protein [Aquabacterium terrae]
MAAPRRKAPWPDYDRRDIHEGDRIVHPSGQRGTVVFLAAGIDPWRVDYGDGLLSRLVLQLGIKGRAVVVMEHYATQKAADAALEPVLTDEFLAILVRAARTVGWECDHVATCDFVRKAFGIAAKPEPQRDDLEPYIETASQRDEARRRTKH